MQITTQAGIHYLHLVGLDQRAAVAVAPFGSETPIAKSVDLMVDQLDGYDKAVAHAKKTGALTPEGIAQHTAVLRTAAQRAIDSAMQGIGATRAAIDAERQSLFAVPTLDAGDAAGAARDREIRERFTQLPQVQRDQLRNEIAQGARDDLLHALLRDPFGGPDHKAAKAIWNGKVATANAEVIKRLDAAEHEIGWAASVAGALHQVLDRYTKAQPRPPRKTEDPTYLNANA